MNIAYLLALVGLAMATEFESGVMVLKEDNIDEELKNN